jgi:hypothetical protein
LRLFDLTQLGVTGAEDVCRHYEEHGYCVLGGLQQHVTNLFYPVLQETLGVSRPDFEEILDPRGRAQIFPPDVRRKLARVGTAPKLAQDLLGALQPVLSHLIGPLAHVSSTFHAQFKGVPAAPVDHGGYKSTHEYMEVHGAYLLHQDFTGASFPTSPSCMTLWVGLNDCPDWPLRLYPGSHRLGLLCNRWLPLDHAGLAALAEPVDIQAQPGTAVIFNALTLHGTGAPGRLSRWSCDIRFFPCCGFLPTYPHELTENPWGFIQEALDRNPGPARRAPLMEDLVLSGAGIETLDAPRFSVLNWVNYLAELLRGEPDRAVPHLTRFTNTQAGVDGPEVYISKFHERAMHPETLRRIQELLAPNPAPAGRA